MESVRLAGMKNRARMFSLLVARGGTLRFIAPIPSTPAAAPVLF